MKKEIEKNILSELCSNLIKESINAKLIDDTSRNLLNLEVTYKTEIGEISFDFRFITDLIGDEKDFSKIQTFVQIHPNASNEKCPSILWMINKINNYSPIGSFGLFEKFDLLYWKNIQMLDLNIDSEKNSSKLLTELHLAKNVIVDFIPSFNEVLNHNKEPNKVLKSNKWASVLFN